MRCHRRRRTARRASDEHVHDAPRRGERRSLIAGRLARRLLRREDHPDAERERDADRDDAEPEPAHPIRVRETERAVQRPLAVADERDREAGGRQRHREFPADLATTGPEALRRVGDDRDDEEIAGDDPWPERAAEPQDHEQTTERFGGGRDEGPEETGPQADAVEPTGHAADRAARADPAELQQAVLHDDAADDDTKDQETEVRGHVALNSPRADLFRRAGADRPQKRQRVAPHGSAVATPNAVVGVIRNRCHGGRPALGALYSAVIAPSLARAGQPWAAYSVASRSSVGMSVTRAAVPSTTRSRPVSATESTTAGFLAMSRLLRVFGPLVK